MSTPRVEERDGLRILHTYGTPFERGLQHGRLLLPLVRDCWDTVWKGGWFAACALFPEWLWRLYARINEPFLTGDERAELRGIAEGAGLRYGDVLVMNSQSPVDVVHGWLMPGTYGGCTQYVTPQLVGRNLDTLTVSGLHRVAMVQVHHPSGGVAFLTPGFAGKVLDGITAWNAAGLHVCQDDAESRHPQPVGVYSGALVRRLAQGCTSVDEAVRQVRRTRWMAGGGKNVTLVDRKSALLLEVKPRLLGGLDVATVGADRIRVTNHFRTLPADAPSRSSRLRLERLEQLTDGQVNAATLREILMDKHDLADGRRCGPDHPSDNAIDWHGPSITGFGPLRVHGELRVATTVSTVSDLEAGVMWVAAGQPWISDPDSFVPIDVERELAER